MTNGSNSNSNSSGNGNSNGNGNGDGNGDSNVIHFIYYKLFIIVIIRCRSLKTKD